MATNFPTSLDTFTNPSSGNTLDSPSHSLQHSDANDAIEAIEAKLGVGASPAGSATAGQVLTISAAGTSAWTTPNSDGLTLITTQTFTAAGSFSLPANTFSSTYNDYLLLVNFTGASTNLNTSMRMRASGTDNTGANYDRGGVLNPTNTGLSALANAGQTLWDLGGINSTYPTYSQWQIIFKSPNTTNAFKSTFAFGTYVNSLGTGVMWWSNNVISSSTQFDSATWTASTGNFTGNYSVYGYRK